MAYQLWMRSLLNRMKELYGHTEAKTIAEALPDGNFFVVKGSVATVSDLPSSGNRVGDIYIVSEDGSEHIWVTNTTYPNGYWEQLGTEGVTAVSVASAIGDMTPQQAATARGNLGAEPEKFVVNLEVIWGNVNTVVSDKTFSEIYAAYNSGKMICAIADEIETKTLFVSNSMCAFMDTIPPLFDGRCFYHLFMVDDQDNWTAYEWEIALTPSVVYSTDTSATIQPEDNKRYEFANSLTSLEIVEPDDEYISYSIIFTSGSTPTTTTIPSTILGLESFAAEANTIYEINVLDNRAVVGSWAVSA